jgi:hypothetical protein
VDKKVTARVEELRQAIYVAHPDCYAAVPYWESGDMLGASRSLVWYVCAPEPATTNTYGKLERRQMYLPSGHGCGGREVYLKFASEALAQDWATMLTLARRHREEHTKLSGLAEEIDKAFEPYRGHNIFGD